MSFLANRKIGFLGTGNLSQAIIEALVSSKTVQPDHVLATNRTPGKLLKMVNQFGIVGLQSNEELLDKADVIVLGTKPQDLPQAIEPIARSFQSHHIVISLAAGIPLQALRKMISQVPQIVRVMPNTASKIRQAVVGYCTTANSSDLDGFVEEMFSPIGIVVKTDEGEAFEALAVSCSAGVGFVFELMIYWQEWLEEHGFDANTARAMTVKTFLGAAMLADLPEETSLTELQAKVSSKKGITAAGLDSMRELEIERALRYSFEKAVLRDRDLGKSNN